VTGFCWKIAKMAEKTRIRDEIRDFAAKLPDILFEFE